MGVCPPAAIPLCGRRIRCILIYRVFRHGIFDVLAVRFFRQTGHLHREGIIPVIRYHDVVRISICNIRSVRQQVQLLLVFRFRQPVSVLVVVIHPGLCQCQLRHFRCVGIRPPAIVHLCSRRTRCILIDRVFRHLVYDVNAVRFLRQTGHLYRECVIPVIRYHNVGCISICNIRTSCPQVQLRFVFRCRQPVSILVIVIHPGLR